MTIPSASNFDPAKRGILMVGVMAATIMQILDTTIANVAIPHMQTSLGATVDTINWVLTSYIIATAVAIPITGWLADQIGSRQLFLWAVGGFVVASMACGVAVNLEQMVAFRFLQGVFAAFIGPLSQTVMLDINPPEKHAKSMAIWGMGIMVGPILGPVLGGWLTDNYNWRWVFYVNMPFGIACFALLWTLLPARPIIKRKFDIFGFSMLAIALTSFQLMLDRGSSEDWFESTEIVIEAAVAIAAFWMFGVQLATSKNPLFERKLIFNRNLLTSLGFMIIVGTVMFASMALLPPMLQRLFGYPVIDTGLILSLRGLGILFSMGIAGKLLGKIDARIMVSTGFTITAISLWQMSQFSLQMDMQPVMISGLVQGLGMGLVFIPLNTMAFGTLEPKYRTDGASLLNLSRNLGASMGISIFSTMLGINIQISHADLGAHITASSINVIDPSTASRFGSIGDATLRILDLEINRQAFMIAYIDDFWIMMWVTAFAIPLVMLLRPALMGDKPKLSVE